MLEGVQGFRKRERDYEQWLYEHPDGFVVNAHSSLRQGYFVLHRASCRSISTYSGRAKEGGFTERKYIKICGPDVESLRAWLKAEKDREINSCYNTLT